MVTKKKTAKKARSRTAAKRTYRRKSGITDIPAAAATVALAAVNVDAVKQYANYFKTYGSVINKPNPAGAFVNRMQKTFINKDHLVKDAAAIAGGYIGGEIVKKYAPAVIKTPLGKLAKKIPKVI